MADRSSSNEAQKIAWPPELKSFDVNLFLGANAADPEQLAQDLANLSPTRPDPTRLFVIPLFVPDPYLPSIGRLTYKPRVLSAGSQLQLTVRSPHAEAGAATRAGKDVGSWEEAWKVIDRHLLPDGKALRFYIAAIFEFSTETWQPVASLPAPMAGLVPDFAGVPLLTGFSLEFPDEGHPIRRLSITVYPPLKEIDGRLNFHLPLSERNTLPTSVVKIATSFQNLLAKPLRGESKPVEVPA